MSSLRMEAATDQRSAETVTVYVLSKTDYHERSENLGVFYTVEVAKTIAEAEEPDRHFEWRDDLGDTIVCLDFGSKGPIYQYNIEAFEVREK